MHEQCRRPRINTAHRFRRAPAEKDHIRQTFRRNPLAEAVFFYPSAREGKGDPRLGCGSAALCARWLKVSISSQPSTLRQQFLRGGRQAGGAVGSGNDLAQHRR